MEIGAVPAFCAAVDLDLEVLRANKTCERRWDAAFDGCSDGRFIQIDVDVTELETSVSGCRWLLNQAVSFAEIFALSSEPISLTAAIKAVSRFRCAQDSALYRRVKSSAQRQRRSA